MQHEKNPSGHSHRAQHEAAVKVGVSFDYLPVTALLFFRKRRVHRRRRRRPGFPIVLLFTGPTNK